MNSKIVQITMLLVTFCFVRVDAQQPWVVPPTQLGTEEFEAALALISDHDFEAARDIYLGIAQAYPGTDAAAEALFSASDIQGMLSGDVASREVLEQVISEFAGSRYEVVARLEVLRRDSEESSIPETITAYDGLIVSLGGVSVTRIVNGDSLTELISEFSALHPDLKLGLLKVYWEVQLMYDTQAEPMNALRVGMFGRGAFAGLPNEDPFLSTNQRSVAAILGQPVNSIGSEPAVPLLSIQTPTQGERLASPVTLSAELRTPNVESSPVDLSTLSVTIDGVDVTWAVKVSVQTALDSSTDFEKISLTYSGTIEPGEHILTIAARAERTLLDQDGAPASVNATVDFVVVDSPPPPPPLTTLMSSKDSIVFLKDPHRNEGANSLLTLEKITGKASRNVVGFDLSNIQTSGLTSASLVFTINPNEHVNGWGNGETVTVQTVNTPWVEGNGKSFGLNNNQQVDGTGSGVTWFSPIDENISNDSANSVVQWDGGSLSANPATAPPVTVTNHQTGEIRFDVTQDVLNGAQHGWLLSKDKENKGSKVSFYSKEGAAAAGNPDLAPRLILEYGSPSADTGTVNGGQTMASAGRNYLKAITRTSERATVKEALQENATLAFAGQVVLTAPLSKTPVVQGAVQVAYRSWLNDSLILANLVRSLA